MSLTATCHCGGTRIELPGLPERRVECNCTYCAKTGAIWGYFGAGEMKIVTDEHSRLYTKSGLNNHHFCGRCGMQTWGDSPDWSENLQPRRHAQGRAQPRRHAGAPQLCDQPEAAG
jgi:hypothetical protein